MKIQILIPVYNDWQSVFKVLEEINSIIIGLGHSFSVLIINDASSENRPDASINFENLKSIKIINMKENRGHARCNAAGLKYILDNEDFDYVIPMDGDGEDRPEEIKQFVDNLNSHPNKVIVGERIKRSEGFFFRFCYFVHKIITYVFTGQSIKFGNYTLLPRSTVQKMINEKATWSSFSGSLAKVEKDRFVVPSIRGSRYFGPTKMSFFKLLIHSLSIVSVFKFRVTFRSLTFSIIYLFSVYPNITMVTIIPIIFVFVLIISVLLVSRRESLDEINNSLINLDNIDILQHR